MDPPIYIFIRYRLTILKTKFPDFEVIDFEEISRLDIQKTVCFVNSFLGRKCKEILKK